MTFEEFVKKFNGKKVDFDNYAGAQCVDLARQYWKDVDGIKEHTGPCATSGGAKDLFLDYHKMPLEKKYFYRIPKNKKFIQGDAVIWGETEKNKFGHIALYAGEIDNSLVVFEQDGFSQDGAKFNIRSKEGLLGCLRKK